MSTLRIIGDVHGQIRPDDLLPGVPRPYLDVLADAAFSVQIGDMGDGETYELLEQLVDPTRHRFFPGNHESYSRFPPHCLGDFGSVELGGVEFFFVRGAASTDRDRLVRLGEELGKTLWHECEELSDDEMCAAEREYLRVRPRIMLTHDAPGDIARFAWEHARRYRAPEPGAKYYPTRTNSFLARLYDRHAPKIWLFGHHHHDWRYREADTLFACVGELSFVDITATGEIASR